MTTVYLVTHIKSKVYTDLVKYSLLSFFYIKEDIQYYIKENQRIFLDCGAYSYATTDKSRPDIEEYIAFCHKYGDKIDAYANMDVIGDDEATYENQMIMEDMGLHPVPVFHQGDDWKYLEEYLKGDHDYIALGGVADPKYRQTSSKWMGKVISSIAELNPTIKTHAFGVTSMAELIKYRFYSCDSSTWTGALQYNKYQNYKGNGVLEEIDAEDSLDRLGLHFGDMSIEAKMKQSVTAWLKKVNYAQRIIPSSEVPFKRAEIELLL
jgi:hypothetical protein